MTEAIESFDVESLTVFICHDDTCMDLEVSGCESDIKLCSFDTRSTLSGSNEFADAQEVIDFCRKESFIPFLLYKYEHGMCMYTAVEKPDDVGYPFNDQWDAGCVGFILVPKDSYEEPLEAANSYLSSVTDWCNGSVYGYTIQDDDGEELDSCWGFVGYEHVEQSAKEAAAGIAEQLPKQLEIEGVER